MYAFIPHSAVECHTFACSADPQNMSVKNQRIIFGWSDLCAALKRDCNCLDEIVASLKLLAHQVKLVASLRKTEEKLFLTWPKEMIGDVTEKIYQVYRDEVRVKRKVLENVAHNHEESFKMLHFVMWVH